MLQRVTFSRLPADGGENREREENKSAKIRQLCTPSLAYGRESSESAANRRAGESLSRGAREPVGSA